MISSRDFSKHQSLSKKSLDKVWKWCEENEQTPLALAYMGTCDAVGNFDFHNISRQLSVALKWSKKRPYGYISKTSEMYDLVFASRDVIGRAILEIIKLESKSTKRVSNVLESD